MEKYKSHSSCDSNSFILAAVTIGASLEWYEIGMFIAWQLIIQQSSITFDVVASFLNVGAVLSVVYTVLALGGARAIGGWFFGKRGDLQGRKDAFILTIFMATLPSLLLVILSFFLSYEKCMAYSTAILIIVRFFQGIPAGGELPGAICYLAEANESSQQMKSFNNQRYMCSYAMLGPQIGLALSTIVCLVLKACVPTHILFSYGWKIVFSISGGMGILALLMRRKLHETIVFLNKKVHHKINYSPLKVVFKRYRFQLLIGSALSIFEIVSFSVLSMVPLYYSKAPFNFVQDQITLMSLGSCFLCIVCLPLVGYLASKYQNFSWLNVSAWAIIPFSFFLYASLLQGNFLLSLIMNIVLIFLFSVQASILPSLLARLFPVYVRYTGIAFSFNICDGILWTIIISSCFWFVSNGNPYFVLFIPLSAAVFLISFRWFKGKNRALANHFM